MDGSKENKRPISKLPTFGSASKRVKLEPKVVDDVLAGSKSQVLTTTTRSATKRTTSSSSLKSTSSSAGKVLPSTTASRPKAAAATSKALFTVGTKSKPSTTRPPQRQTSTSKVKSKLSKSPVKDRTSTDSSKGKPKRAAWDTKGLLSDLRDEFEQFRKNYEAELRDKEEQQQQLVVEKTHEINSVESRLTEQLGSLKAEHNAEKERLVDQVTHLETERDSLKKKLDNSQLQVESLNDQVDQLTKELRLSKKEVAMLHLTEKENKFEIESKTTSIHNLNDKCSKLEHDLRESAELNKSLEEQKRQHEMERRKLHNTIQELKGNIRVFCRIRPANKSDGDVPEIYNCPDLDHKKLTLMRPSNINESTMNETLKRTEKLDFQFDKVFEPDSSQAIVFEEISQLVQSALDGYNVCIFAYGQTGSGKTYTMQGPDHMTEATEGMIPRSIAQIFESASQLTTLGWTYTMEASFMEIYNETIKDLLGVPGKEEKHEIKTASGEVVVTNMTTIPVTQPRQVENLFERATKNRHVAETNCNARSSRSHSVFTLKISGKNDITSETCTGTLNLVDLAGSERLKESKSEGDRLKETQCINASLSALGNVIMSLAAKKSHIPYRDSKLTYLLQNSLGGNSKTLMFVNMSPDEEHFNESVNSLRFATKVNNCSIGTAKKVVK